MNSGHPGSIVGHKQKISSTGNILELAPLAVGLDQWKSLHRPISGPEVELKAYLLLVKSGSGCMQLLQCNCYIHWLLYYYYHYHYDYHGFYCCHHYHYYHFYSKCCSMLQYIHNSQPKHKKKWSVSGVIHLTAVTASPWWWSRPPKVLVQKTQRMTGCFGDMVGISLHWVGKKQMP